MLPSMRLNRSGLVCVVFVVGVTGPVPIRWKCCLSPRMMWLMIHKKGPFVTAVSMVGVVAFPVVLIPPNGEIGPLGVAMSSCGIPGWYCLTNLRDLGERGGVAESTT